MRMLQKLKKKANKDIIDRVSNYKKYQAKKIQHQLKWK